MTPQETFAIIITVAKEQRTLREWRNRQTRTFEGRVVIPYGFKSRLSHQKTAYTLCGLLFLFWGLEPGRVSALRKCAGGTFLAESARAVPHAKRGVTRASSMRCAAPQTVKSRLSHQKNSLHFVWAVFSVYGTCCREGVGVVPHALQTASQSLRRLKYDGISMTKK